jgi:hypothetical protein
MDEVNLNLNLPGKVLAAALAHLSSQAHIAPVAALHASLVAAQHAQRASSQAQAASVPILPSGSSSTLPPSLATTTPKHSRLEAPQDHSRPRPRRRRVFARSQSVPLADEMCGDSFAYAYFIEVFFIF